MRKLAPRTIPRFSMFLMLLLSLGCSANQDAKSRVTGKVMIDDKPVAGEVTFVCADGSEFKSPIGPDGSYCIFDAPKGKAEILITTFDFKDSSMSAPDGDASAKEPLPGETSSNSGVSPPAKYGQKNNGLVLDVTGETQEHDIRLTP